MLLDGSVESIRLEDIDFTELKSIKRAVESGAVREVYVDKNGDYYYKIWSPNNKRIRNFLQAISAGFYDDIAPLVNIIYDGKGCCRGYITKGGIVAIKSPLEKEIINSGRNKITRIAELNKQIYLPYKEFYHRLLKTIKEKGYVHIDYTPSNLIFIDQEYKLIDLEAVLSIYQVNNSFFSDIHIPSDYRNFVKTIKSKNLKKHPIKKCIRYFSHS